MEEKNEEKAIRKDKNANEDKSEIIKPNKSSINKNSENDYVGKRKAKRKSLNSTSLQKKTTSLNDLEQFLNLNKENKTIYDQKGYQKVEMNEIEKKIMVCFNYLMKYDNESNEIINAKEREIIIVIIDEEASFEIIDFTPPFIIRLYYHDKQIEEILYYTSRKITFIDDTQRVIYEKFIYNIDNLNDVLKEFGFKYFYIKINQNTSKVNKKTNSINTKLPIEDPSIIIYDKSINVIYKDYIMPILTEENYNKRFKYPISILKDLKYNCKEYYAEDSNKKYFYLKEYDNASLNFFDFRNHQASKIIYLYGPKNCSKTTFLFCLINKFKFSQTGTLYFNYSHLKDKFFIDIKKIIYNEILYFCRDIEEMKIIKNFKIFDGINNYKNTMKLIHQLLINLFQVIGEEDKYIRIIIIDNINNLEEKDEAFTILDEIKKLILRKNFNYKLIICGRGKYFNKNFINSYKNFQFMTNDKVYKYIMDEYTYLFSTNLNENIIKIDENLILNEIKKLENYDFYALFFAEELHDKNLSYCDIISENNLLRIMPLEYFKIILKDDEKAIDEFKLEEENDKTVNFSFYNQLYKEAIKRQIEFRVNKGILNNLLKTEQYPRTVFGKCFEKLIILLLKNNQLNDFDLKFDKNNIKEVNEISNFKEKNFDYVSLFNNMDKEKPILITQFNYSGKFYDLLIIKKHNNNFSSNFIKIGADKTEREIDIILNDLKENESLYNKNICDELGINRDLNKISLIYIFDLETQGLNNFSSGVHFCKRKKIVCYLFSTRERKFLFYNDNTKSLTYINSILPCFTTTNNINTIKKEKDTRIEQYFHKIN